MKKPDDNSVQDPNEIDPVAAYYDNIFIPRSSALSVLRGKRSSGREGGVYCECCVHRCDIYEMRAYCGVERRKRATDLTDLLSNSSPNNDKSNIS
jgi:hypothetical protein